FAPHVAARVGHRLFRIPLRECRCRCRAYERDCPRESHVDGCPIAAEPSVENVRAFDFAAPARYDARMTLDRRKMIHSTLAAGAALVGGRKLALAQPGDMPGMPGMPMPQQPAPPPP